MSSFWWWTGITIVFYIAISLVQKIVYAKKGIEIKKETKSKKEIEEEKIKENYNENM